MLIAWALFGALLGVAAAQKKGFSLAGGIIGGLLLGPLAFLLFFVSSVGGEARKKCALCKEWIQADATVCRHCHRVVTSSGRRPAPIPPERSARPVNRS